MAGFRPMKCRLHLATSQLQLHLLPRRNFCRMCKITKDSSNIRRSFPGTGMGLSGDY